MQRIDHTRSGPHFFSTAHTTSPQRVVTSQSLNKTPPHDPDVNLSRPARHILLVTLERRGRTDVRRRKMHYRLGELWGWFEAEPELRCAVVTGRGMVSCSAGTGGTGGGKPIMSAATNGLYVLDGAADIIVDTQDRDGTIGGSEGVVVVEEALRWADGVADRSYRESKL